MYYNDGILGWVMYIMRFAFPIIFILVLFKIFSRKNNSFDNLPSDRSNKTPLDILKERYAKGEITREEFQKMKDDINR